MKGVKKLGALVQDWVPPPKPNSGPLIGKYVKLEALDADLHAEDLYRANCVDDAIWDYLPYGPFPSLASYSQWVRNSADGADPHFWAVRNLDTGHCGGVASYLRITPESGSIEIGHINFAPELQKTPAATEAIFLMMEWAFESGYRRFEWKCNALNLGSRRAAQRFGFSFEGVFRQATITKGRNRDTAWFACIDKEWPALRDAYRAWLDPSNFDENGLQIESLATLTHGIRVADDPAL